MVYIVNNLWVENVNLTESMTFLVSEQSAEESEGSNWHSSVGRVMQSSPEIIDVDLFKELTANLSKELNGSFLHGGSNYLRNLTHLTGKQTIKPLKLMNFNIDQETRKARKKD